MADPYELACKKSGFGFDYMYNDTAIGCSYQTVNVIRKRYITYLNFGLLVITAILSILIRKIYAWVILNQTLLHLYNHVILMSNSNNVLIFARIIPTSIFTFCRSTALISPYVSMLGLALSRYIAFYFPHFYDKHVTNIKIFPIILLWDLMCFVPFWGWQYVYFYTDFQECPRYRKNVCDIVNTYFTGKDNAKTTRIFFLKEYFDVKKMKNDRIATDLCFEYKTCILTRGVPYNDNITRYIQTGLAIITLILSIFLFARIVKHVKVQSKMKTSSIKTSFRIALILLLQAIYFFIDNLFSVSESFFEKYIIRLMGKRAYEEVFVGIYPAFYYLFVTIDCFLIMFLLTDYRYYLLYFIPKRQSHRVAVLSSSSNMR